MKKYNIKFMKKLIYFTVIGLFSISLISSCTSKSKNWSDDQKTKWKENCMNFMGGRGVDNKSAVDFCDCMLDKTSQKYSPEDATKITPDEERKLWQDCGYQW